MNSLKEGYNPLNDTLSIKAEVRCLEGNAPPEDLVEAMYNNIDRTFKYKNKPYKEQSCNQYWIEAMGSDDMIFAVIKEYR